MNYSENIGLECQGGIGHGLPSRLMIAFLVILESAAPSPPLFQTMKMHGILCISYDSGANRFLLGHFQNYEHDNNPMRFLRF